ncbi:receptor-like protein 43 isoform X2 [Camellia sinensis]|uniref:receptor-like protein 43 isoform X2 n=1 Tax=Camellia sinensis TaxID=4442 RepID=UPI001036D538|nr:receptor-like protein 43 isoform X2 [Camellia sinensis]
MVSNNQLFHLFLFLCFFQITCLHAQLCTQEQTSALLQFKKQFSFNNDASYGNCAYYGIDSYPKMESWKEGSDCCSWDGVECDNNTSQVIGLDLSCSWLNGTIHPNTTIFYYFPHLQSLNLAFNDFGMSPISSEFRRFTRLTDLKLSGSNFSGKVPIEVSFLSKLISLDLSYNYGLRLEEPGFELLVQNLTKVRELNLARVNISSVVSNSLLNLITLTLLDLGSCGLLGKFPDGIFHLPHLNELSIVDNAALTGYFPEFINSSSPLQYLALSVTNFSGELPDSIGNLKSLTALYAGRCKFYGSIPTSLGNLTEMIELEIGRNNFTGMLPSSLSNLGNLVYLAARGNNFEGPLPSQIIGLPNLEWLDLADNLINGNFSTYFFVLNLRKNNFSGTIPNTFVKGNSFKTINLNGNGFEGTVPKSLVNCKMLRVLDLGCNKFSDKFPYWLEKLHWLQVLILRSNKFHGPMPTSKAKFPFLSLRVMDLSDNNFTGPLPKAYFKNFNAMMNVKEANFQLQYIEIDGPTVIYYYHDFLTMVIKGSTIEMEKVLTIFIAIDLSKNNFEGEIPEIIGRLNSIQGLNLSHNSLTGHIPASLANLTMLEWLDLSSNKLIGEIPQQLRNLISLEVLNLSQNQLIGPIPQGNQFDTFLNDSYFGNLALCGPPLSSTCSDPRTPQQEDDTYSLSGFNWYVILPGYACGLVWGLVMGYLMFSRGKPRWLVRIIEGERNQSRKRFKKHVQRNRGR